MRFFALLAASLMVHDQVYATPINPYAINYEEAKAESTEAVETAMAKM
jgi:hypothetical protein